MIKSFSPKTRNEIDHYIYLYIDPRDNSVFYIGKGKDNRAFDHLKDQKENEKVRRIEDIRDSGHEPVIEILVHGISSDETIRKIEAAAIDLIGLQNLTNIQSGYESIKYGRKKLDEIESMYDGKLVEIKEPAIMINICSTFRYGMAPIELYDATRSAWVVGTDREKAKYAMPVYGNVIQEVYEIKQWFEKGSTFNSRLIESDISAEKRWEFIGKIAIEEIRNMYKLKKTDAFASGSSNPIKYLNIKE
jgi:hypothetical protein